MERSTAARPGHPTSQTGQTKATTTTREGTMQAIVHDRYGSPDVLALADVEHPALGDDGVVVRVRAASVNALDWHLLRGTPYFVRLTDGLRRPRRRIAGVDVAGVVEAVGKDVTAFRPGDEVFGQRGGAFAEFVGGRERNFVRKPANLTFEQAAAIPVAATSALQALRDKGRVQSGQRVLINGAGGGVGTFAVQLAKAFGADVTAVTRGENVDLVRSIGADRVLDATRADFTRDAQRFDLIIDIAANHPLTACRRVLTPDGVLVVVGAPDGRWVAPLARVVEAVVRSRLGGQRLLPFLAAVTKDDLTILADLAEAGKVTPVIDRVYPLRDTAEAIRYVETGHARGKVVITV